MDEGPTQEQRQATLVRPNRVRFQISRSEGEKWKVEGEGEGKLLIGGAYMYQSVSPNAAKQSMSAHRLPALHTSTHECRSVRLAHVAFGEQCAPNLAGWPPGRCRH